MKIIEKKLTKEIHFPIIQAMVDNHRKLKWYSRVCKFMMYRRKFKIQRDHILYSVWLKKYIFTPKGFLYDGASVPKILNGIFSSTGMLFFASHIHDFGYRYEGLVHIDLETGALYFVSYTKSQLDKIFKNLCIQESGMKVASTAATLTLSGFGFLGWRENRKKDSNLFNDFPELFIAEVDSV